MRVVPLGKRLLTVKQPAQVAVPREVTPRVLSRVISTPCTDGWCSLSQGWR